MKTAIVVSGPRGAGKTSYIKKVIRRHPEVVTFNFDALCWELLGRPMDGAYHGHIMFVQDAFNQRVKHAMSVQRNKMIIVDIWNPFSQNRKDLIDDLRIWGADRVLCWYFLTPLDVCIQWFMRKSKDEIRGIDPGEYPREYSAYHEYAANIDKDGFDDVRRLDPCQETLPWFDYLKDLIYKM